jgi:hypothetical protein
MRGLIAVDPGKTTGMAYAQAGETPFAWEIEEGQEAPDWVAANVAPFPDAWEVVCESFVIGPNTMKKSRGNWSLELIGALRYICWKYDVPFTLQSPGDAKRFSTDAKLKRVDWWTPTKGGHANDALRHLMLRRAKTDPEFGKTLLAD